MIVLYLALAVATLVEAISRLMGRRLPGLLGDAYWTFLALAGVHLTGLVAAQFPDVAADQWREAWHPAALTAMVWVAIMTLLVAAGKVVAVPIAWHVRRSVPDGEDVPEALEAIFRPFHRPQLISGPGRVWRGPSRTVGDAADLVSVKKKVQTWTK